MFSYIARFIEKIIKEPILNELKVSIQKNELQHALSRKESQILLMLKYKELVNNKQTLPAFGDIGFRVFSGADEDGILLYIFSLIGVTSKKLIDIGSAGIDGSNTANLILNHGWSALLVESNAKTVNYMNKFYSSCTETKLYPPILVNEFVNVHNINAIIAKNHFDGEVDLFCLDIDGIDYWVWNALEVVNPRVVLVEFQAIWGADRSVTIPYKEDFQIEYYGELQLGLYSGASLPAFVKLAKQKGYRLVGCHRYGFNAFFIRNDIAMEILPEISVEKCFDHPFAQYAVNELQPLVRDKYWEEV
ncbi:MAG TPA: hypothetical protein DCS13_04915 [Candidatus Margulisbacteria bacterium]|nr:MAG: hypothetical protein A2X43_00260 [Candidatus Margulisbacteria bacterium GWD2_39_127]HAR62786.1 hypothetical protein [Candidatus Margulisiibacteriota bacterium]